MTCNLHRHRQADRSQVPLTCQSKAWVQLRPRFAAAAACPATATLNSTVHHRRLGQRQHPIPTRRQPHGQQSTPILLGRLPRAWSATWFARNASGAGTSGGSSSSSSVTAGPTYLGRGPYTASPPVPLKFLVGPGRSGALDCSLKVFLPTGGEQRSSPPQRWPLVVLSAGFLLHSGLYGSYATELASWGLAVVLYDLPELVDDVTMVSVLGSVIDACTGDPRVGPYVDPRAILLAGHSRGGKLSVLAAASDPRVKGVALLDPVDVTSMTPKGPGYPSALPAMRAACGPPRDLPALVVGAACNSGVIPEDANYRRFVMSCPGPCWFVELTGAGHLQFIDAKVDLLSALVESGPTPDEAVRRVSRAALTAWALELAVPLARGEAFGGGPVLERLQRVAAALEREAPVSWSFKGFGALGGTAGASGRAATAGAGTSSSSDIGGGNGRSAAAAAGHGAGAGGANVPAETDTGLLTGSGPSSSSSSSSSSWSQSATTGTSSGSGGTGGGAGACEGCGGLRREDLMRLRARELKAILVERGVNCSDCFEKADLVRRILERC